MIELKVDAVACHAANLTKQRYFLDQDLDIEAIGTFSSKIVVLFWPAEADVLVCFSWKIATV